MATYKTPGVYVEEISKLPPSVAQVETAIPAFIGYTQNVTYNGLTLKNKPKRIKSLKEYEEIFGFPQEASFTIKIATVSGKDQLTEDVTPPVISFRLYYALQLYFANGGGPCYITSIESYANVGATSTAKLTDMQNGLAAIRKEDEPTILLFPDAPSLAEDDFYQIYKDALKQSAELMDRVTVVDVFNTGSQAFDDVEANFRSKIGNNYMSYAAAYYPWLNTNIPYYVNENTHAVTGGTIAANTVLKRKPASSDGVYTQAELDTSLFHSNNQLYFDVKNSMSKWSIILPPSSAVAGVYAMVDNARGVWKAPANVSLSLVKEPMVKIDDGDQGNMNIHTSGKSVNAIRAFSDKGVLVWGARTLAGNDNEWRYISVRRFYNMVEESVKKATEPFVFEPNDGNTWAKIKGMVENFLILQWRAGALMGAKPNEAFFVNVGLGETMTALDILEGRLIVEIGMAVVRPAEFIILRFSHKMIGS